MAYEAPLKDILFDLEHLSAWSSVTALPKYDHVDQSDAEAVLTEYARFCSEVIAPLGRIGDETSAKFDGEKVILPAEFEEAYNQFVEMGWQSLSHSTDHGGMGFPIVAGAAATEMLNSADMSFGLCPLLTDGAIDALTARGSDSQKETYLSKLISGEWSATMNLTEPQAGSDLGRIRTKAEAKADGTYAITGNKLFITYGEHDLSGNIIHLVLARTPDAPAGPKGLSLFIVPKYLEGDAGANDLRNKVQCISIEHKLGVRASPTAVLQYEGATGYLIGEENRGLDYMFVMMTSARFAVGMQGVAISERAYQQALAYAVDRIQSRPLDGSSRDAVAIIEHPDVQRMLLRMKALTEGCRALAYATAGWIDLSKNGREDQRTEAHDMAEFLVPLVKAYCTEKAVEVTSLNVQVHGGMGFIEETGAAQLYRDARILPIYEGTTAIQANDLLGRKILRDGGKTALLFSEMIAETELELERTGERGIQMAEQLRASRAAFEECLDWLLETTPHDINAAFASAQPFLMLTANLATAWQLGRSVLVAEAKIKTGEDKDFMTDKITTAQFYMQHLLVDVMGDCARVISGSESLFAAKLSVD